jgi:hypothetical protein
MDSILEEAHLPPDARTDVDQCRMTCLGGFVALPRSRIAVQQYAFQMMHMSGQHGSK